MIVKYFGKFYAYLRVDTENLQENNVTFIKKNCVCLYEVIMFCGTHNSEILLLV